MTWTPIDDKERPAPEDEYALVYCGSEMGWPNIYVAVRMGESWHERAEFRTVYPTHYMPLPPPPEEG